MKDFQDPRDCQDPQEERFSRGFSRVVCSYVADFCPSSLWYGVFWFKFNMQVKTVYHKVASSSLSRLVAHFKIFIRLMKGKFDTYVL